MDAGKHLLKLFDALQQPLSNDFVGRLLGRHSGIRRQVRIALLLEGEDLSRARCDVLDRFLMNDAAEFAETGFYRGGGTFDAPAIQTNIQTVLRFFGNQAGTFCVSLCSIGMKTVKS